MITSRLLSPDVSRSRHTGPVVVSRAFLHARGWLTIGVIVISLCCEMISQEEPAGPRTLVDQLVRRQ